MLRSLKPHPSTPSTSVNSLTVEATRTPAGILHLRYRLEGDIARLHLPDPDGPSRKDNLWHHTCFEVFIAPGTDPAYREFNLAPSTRWAAYRFTAYRKGMANLDQPHPPIITFTATDREIRLDSIMFPHLSADEPWRLAVTTVIEEKSGHKSFWSLHHPDTRPEFHHPEGFVLRLEAP